MNGNRSVQFSLTPCSAFRTLRTYSPFRFRSISIHMLSRTFVCKDSRSALLESKKFSLRFFCRGSVSHSFALVLMKYTAQADDAMAVAVVGIVSVIGVDGICIGSLLLYFPFKIRKKM